MNNLIIYNNNNIIKNNNDINNTTNKNLTNECKFTFYIPNLKLLFRKLFCK